MYAVVLHSVQVAARIHLRWKQLSVLRGSSLAVAAKLLYWSAVMYNLHVGASSLVEIDGEMLAEKQLPQSVDTNHVRYLYFSLLQCLLQVRAQHILQRVVTWKSVWLYKKCLKFNPLKGRGVNWLHFAIQG